jgi:hypothetical protein
MRYTHAIERGRVSVRFDAKPDADIRAMLKAAGFRWSPQAGLWWRSRVVGFADFLAALDKRLNPGVPDGACHVCGDPKGFWRQWAACTYLHCDECWRALCDQRRGESSQYRAHDDPMGADTLYEDQCRQQCGL